MIVKNITYKDIDVVSKLKAKRITRHMLAQYLGKPDSTIRSIINNDMTVTPEFAQEILQAIKDI